MIFLIFLSLSHVTHSDEIDCTFKVSEKDYDLSPLRSKTVTGNDTKISTYHYAAAVCADMTDVCQDIMTGGKKRGVVYQFGRTEEVCWGVRAKWDSVTALPLDPSSGVSGKDGLTLSFQNGDSCMGSPGKVKMNMICDTNEIGTVSGFEDDSDTCLFIINFPTLHACSGTPKPSHSPTLEMPSQAPTYHGPQITAQIEFYDDSSCSIRSSEYPDPRVEHVPRGLCINLDPDDEYSRKYGCLSETEIQMTSYNETNCMVANEEITFSINQCIIADTDDDDKPILWQKLSQLQGCDSTDKPTTAMPSQAPTYYGPQIEAKIQVFYDSGCTNRTNDPQESASIVKDRCIDDQDDGSSQKATCKHHTGFKTSVYNNTNCEDSGLQNSVSFSVGECKVLDRDPDGNPTRWMKLVKIEGCGSKKSESFFNLENSLLVSGGCLIFVLIIGFGALYYCRKEKDDGPYSNLQS